MPAPRTVLRVGRCGSTMDEARSLAESGAADGAVIATEAQDRGRGTKGRSWLSRPGLGLYASYLLRPRRGEILRLELLPLAAGLAARDAWTRALRGGERDAIIESSAAPAAGDARVLEWA